MPPGPQFYNLQTYNFSYQSGKETMNTVITDQTHTRLPQMLIKLSLKATPQVTWEMEDSTE
jgi:hypothetical protein